mmetsp:Transcript_62509/g.183244  ORF Transcript_62509/g.183244 Transcript_62509/m.183244 type:complete len:531 (-) Transcript_62509:93-1685(-)
MARGAGPLPRRLPRPLPLAVADQRLRDRRLGANPGGSAEEPLRPREHAAPHRLHRPSPVDHRGAARYQPGGPCSRSVDDGSLAADDVAEEVHAAGAQEEGPAPVLDVSGEDPVRDEGAGARRGQHHLCVHHVAVLRGPDPPGGRGDPARPASLHAGVGASSGEVHARDALPASGVHRGRLPRGAHVLPDHVRDLEEAGPDAWLLDRRRAGDVCARHGRDLRLLLRLLPAQRVPEPNQPGLRGGREDADVRPDEDCRGRDQPDVLHRRPVLPSEGGPRGDHPALHLYAGGLQHPDLALEVLEALQPGRHAPRLHRLVDRVHPHHLHGRPLRHRQRRALLCADDDQGRRHAQGGHAGQAGVPGQHLARQLGLDGGPHLPGHPRRRVPRAPLLRQRGPLPGGGRAHALHGGRGGVRQGRDRGALLRLGARPGQDRHRDAQGRPYRVAEAQHHVHHRRVEEPRAPAPGASLRQGQGAAPRPARLHDRPGRRRAAGEEQAGEARPAQHRRRRRRQIPAAGDRQGHAELARRHPAE